jgi:hypothetical protein
VREVLKEAGDAVVLEPADAREAVRVAAQATASALEPAVTPEEFSAEEEEFSQGEEFSPGEVSPVP